MSSIWNTLQGVPFQQTYINAGGVNTRVIEAGEGPVLIFLHGTGGHAEAYLRNIEEHAKHFRVMAIDMVGHGYSDMPDLDYGPQDYVDFMLNFIDAIGADTDGDGIGGGRFHQHGHRRHGDYGAQGDQQETNGRHRLLVTDSSGAQ